MVEFERENLQMTHWFDIKWKDGEKLNTSLYELTGQFLELQEMLLDPEAEVDVIKDTMEGIEGEIEIKADNYAKAMRNLDAQAMTIRIEMERLRSRLNRCETGQKMLKENLYQSMVVTGKRKFKTDLFTFSIQKNGGKAPVIMDVQDTSELPDELVRIEEKPDLDAIRTLIEKEGSCKYAHLGERGESLRIK